MGFLVVPSTQPGNLGPRLGLVISSGFFPIADEVIDLHSSDMQGSGPLEALPREGAVPQHRQMPFLLIPGFDLTLQSLFPLCRALSHVTQSSKNNFFCFEMESGPLTAAHDSSSIVFDFSSRT